MTAAHKRRRRPGVAYVNPACGGGKIYSYQAMLPSCLDELMKLERCKRASFIWFFVSSEIACKG